MSGKNSGKNVMTMAKISKPELMQLFENMLWANSPKDWILQSTYFHETLFVSMIIKTSDNNKNQKIRRNFNLKTISDRSEDLWGLASDCIDEMKNDIKK